MNGRSFTGTDGVRARRQQKEAVRQRRVNEAVEVAGGTVELSGINLAEDGGAVAAAALTRLRSAVTVLAADGCELSGAGAARLARWAVRLPPWSQAPLPPCG